MRKASSHGRTIAAVLAAAICVPALAAQDDDALKTPAEKIVSEAESLAFVDVDVYTGDGKKLEKVTVLVEDGKFTGIGKDLAVPPSFRRIDGGFLVPGLVLTGSTTSLTRGSTSSRAPQMIIIGGRMRRMPSRGRSRGKATFSPHVKVTTKIKPEAKAWADLLKGGVTTHGMRPVETGLSGLGGVVRPVGRKKEDMVIADEKFLWVGMAANTSTKKMLKENFKKAKDLLKKREEAKKKAAAPKKPAAPAKAPAKKPAEAPKKEAPKKEPPKKEPPKKEPPKKEPPKKEPPKPGQGKKPAAPAKAPAKKPAKPKEDPKLAVLAKVLEKKLGVFVGVSGAGDMLHLLDALEDTDFPLTIVHDFSDGAQDTLDKIIALLKSRKATVVLPVEFGYRPHTRFYTNPVRKLVEAKIPVVLQPGQSKTKLDTLWWRLNKMARAGIPREKLVQQLTLEPAKLLGVGKQVGSIAKGKDANLMHFSRDPFSAASRLINVYLEGRTVEAMARRN